jgi:acyl-CoA reductase-like NAD-dependent aldehyde dehydrogenase
VVAAPFSDLDEIAAAANDTEYGLGAGIWTKDISKAHALAKKIRVGTVWINCYVPGYRAGRRAGQGWARSFQGRTNRSTALAKPSSSLDVVTRRAARWTSWLALPMAMLIPTWANMSTSLGMSPIVAMSSRPIS